MRTIRQNDAIHLKSTFGVASTVSTVNLRKGQKIDFTKHNPGVSKVLVGLGWDVNDSPGGADFDLDAAAFLLDANGRAPSAGDFVSYNNVRGPSGLRGTLVATVGVRETGTMNRSLSIFEESRITSTRSSSP